MKMSWLKLMLVGLMLGSLGIGSAFGAGFQLYNEGSAEAVGLAGAISARRDMISNAWYNPASVTDFKESRLMLGVTAVNLRSDYASNRNAAIAPGLNDFDASLENKWNAIPNFFYIHPMNECLTLSLAFNMPYGLATSWDWENNTIGPNVSEMISLKPLYFSPAVSFAVNEKLSVAAGVNIVYASAMLRQFLGPLGKDMKLEADAWGYGYMFGGNYKMNDEWTVAAKYQSPVYLKLMGEANYLPGDPGTVGANKGAEANLTLPQTVTLGIANNSIDKWTFGADILWTNWSQYDKLAFTFEDAPTDGPGLNTTTIGTQKNWNDVFSYRVSAEYEMSEAWKLRFGYEYDDSPVPDTTRAAEMPDSDRHVLAVGLAYDRENWGVDFAYSIAMFDSSDANPKGTELKIPAGATQADVLSGDYLNTFAHLVSVAYRFKF